MQVDKPEQAKAASKTQAELVDELLGLVHNFGTKMGNLIYYLRRLWDKAPETRVIIFSQVWL